MVNYKLTWDSHCSSLLSFLGSYLASDKLVDVTLAAEGKVIHVHRLVLLASSPYFEELLSLYPEKQAVVFLKDVPFFHLQAIVDFIYTGRVTVAEDHLFSFIHTADSLKIKGLTVVGDWKQLSSMNDEVLVNKSAVVEPSRETTVPVGIEQQQEQNNEPLSNATMGLVEEQSKPAEPTAAPLITAGDLISNEAEVEEEMTTGSDENQDSIDKELEAPVIISNPTTSSEVQDDETNDTAPDLSSSLVNNSASSTSEMEDDEDNDDVAPDISNSVLSTSTSVTSEVEHVEQKINNFTIAPHLDNLQLTTPASSAEPQLDSSPSLEKSSHSHRRSWSLRVRFNSKSRSSTANSTPRRESTSRRNAVEGKRFVCPNECGKSYQTNDSLRRHLKHECGLMPQFQCPLCSYCCKLPGSLRRHTLSLHSDTEAAKLVEKEGVDRDTPVHVDDSKGLSDEQTSGAESAASPEYEVEKILDRCLIASESASYVDRPPTESDYVYLVSWKGCKEETWEPYTNLTKCRKKLNEFYRRINSAAPDKTTRRNSK